MLKNHIPNLLTLANLLCGLFIIISAFQLQFVTAIYFAVAALVFDFFDGTAARYLKSTSTIGKELDSMADNISFGAAPALVLFNYWINEIPQGFEPNTLWQEIIPYFALIIAASAGYRLAKFNISEEQSKEFFGLASPAAAIFIVGLFIIHTQGIEVQSMIGQKWLLILVSIIISALMVSNIPMFSFKLSGFSWQENKVQIVFVILSILLFLLFKIGALPLVIILYILINIARSFLSTP